MNMQNVSQQERLEWFNEARFGMFIHWGVYSLLSRAEWVMFHERMTPGEYAPLADRFNPQNYDPNKWAKLAVESGMKYMVLTTRHHDGFCLFDSKVSGFTAPKTAAKRDLVAEYVQAARKLGLRVGFYYSLGDWRFCERPGSWRVARERRDELVAQAHEQMRELMTNYGKVDLVWYDGAPVLSDVEGGIAEYWEAEKLNQMVRDLQPDILINNRSGLPEDCDTPEQHIRASEPGRAWELCMTIDSMFWGYAEHALIWKTVPELIQCLVEAAAGEGNLLLNVGPRPDGTIRKEESERLLEMGKWLRRNGEAIYGCRRSPVSEGVSSADWYIGPTTAKGDSIYWCITRYPGPETVLPSGTPDPGWVTFKGLKVKSASLLATGDQLTVKDEGFRIRLSGLPETPPDPYCTVVKLEVERASAPLT